MKLVQEYMMPAMAEVGRRFECNEYFVPELLLAARAMKAALELIRPLLVASGAKPAARVAIGTVKGDLHDIGKNLVMAMLEGGGYEVVDDELLEGFDRIYIYDPFGNRLESMQPIETSCLPLREKEGPASRSEVGG